MKVRGYQKQGKYGKLIAVFCGKLIAKIYGKVLAVYNREYLRENNPMLFNDLVLSCQLWTYLADINEQAQGRLQNIISQIQKAETVTEKMKEYNQWEWIQRMGGIYDRAEEIVLNELIYA